MAWPIILALVLSGVAFAVYMGFLVLPIIRNRNILAPYGSHPEPKPIESDKRQRIRARITASGTTMQNSAPPTPIFEQTHQARPSNDLVSVTLFAPNSPEANTDQAAQYARVYPHGGSQGEGSPRPTPTGHSKPKSRRTSRLSYVTSRSDDMLNEPSNVPTPPPPVHVPYPPSPSAQRAFNEYSRSPSTPTFSSSPPDRSRPSTAPSETTPTSFSPSSSSSHPMKRSETLAVPSFHHPRPSVQRSFSENAAMTPPPASVVRVPSGSSSSAETGSSYHDSLMSVVTSASSATSASASGHYNYAQSLNKQTENLPMGLCLPPSSFAESQPPKASEVYYQHLPTPPPSRQSGKPHNLQSSRLDSSYAPIPDSRSSFLNMNSTDAYAGMSDMSSATSPPTLPPIQAPTPQRPADVPGPHHRQDSNFAPGHPNFNAPAKHTPVPLHLESSNYYRSFNNAQSQSDQGRILIGDNGTPPPPPSPARHDTMQRLRSGSNASLSQLGPPHSPPPSQRLPPAPQLLASSSSTYLPMSGLALPPVSPFMYSDARPQQPISSGVRY